MPTNANGFVIDGAIEQKWLQHGGRVGDLALPTTNEEPTFDRLGRWQGFERGQVSWHHDIGAFAVVGLIGGRWWELKRAEFGYAITDEGECPDKKGRFNHFRALHLPGQPERSIY